MDKNELPLDTEEIQKFLLLHKKISMAKRVGKKPI
jgi:hypothetical protein